MRGTLQVKWMKQSMLSRLSKRERHRYKWRFPSVFINRPKKKKAKEHSVDDTNHMTLNEWEQWGLNERVQQSMTELVEWWRKKILGNDYVVNN